MNKIIPYFVSYQPTLRLFFLNFFLFDLILKSDVAKSTIVNNRLYMIVIYNLQKTRKKNKRRKQLIYNFDFTNFLLKNFIIAFSSS